MGLPLFYFMVLIMIYYLILLSHALLLAYRISMSLPLFHYLVLTMLYCCFMLSAPYLPVCYVVKFLVDDELFYYAVVA
jgi:hypothetical protein